MGYRDDELAFRRRRDLLAKEVDELVGLREELVAHQTSMRETLRKARLKLALVKARRWVGRHPILTIVMLVIVAIFTMVRIEIAQKERARKRRVAEVLGRGCETQLAVSAWPVGRVYVNGVSLGKTPVQRAICPGRYLVQVNSRRTIPWQRKIVVGGEKQLNLHADLIRLRHRPNNAMVIHSEPENAVVFVDGQEVGITPVMVRRKKGSKLLVGLWAPGHQGRGQRVPFARDVWFQLAPVSAEAGGRGAR